jgi:hypothetical protein
VHARAQAIDHARVRHAQQELAECALDAAARLGVELRLQRQAVLLLREAAALVAADQNLGLEQRA